MVTDTIHKCYTVAPVNRQHVINSCNWNPTQVSGYFWNGPCPHKRRLRAPNSQVFENCPQSGVFLKRPAYRLRVDERNGGNIDHTAHACMGCYFISGSEWTGENDSNTLRVDAYLFENDKNIGGLRKKAKVTYPRLSGYLLFHKKYEATREQGWT